LANSRAASIFGYQRQDLIGRPMQSLLSGHLSRATENLGTPQQAPPVQSAMPQFDLMGWRRDGSLVPIEIRSSPQATSDGLLTASVIRDLSDLKETEAALHLRERAMEAITQGILITDPTKPNNPIIYVNPA